MLSRVANTLFWLGRYTERAENYSRFIEVNFNLSIDLPVSIKEQWEPLITATGDKEVFISLYGEHYTRENAIFFLAFDERNDNSIISTITKARENARIVREIIPFETWEVINELYFYIKSALKNKVWARDDPKDSLKQIKYKLQLLSGIAYGTVPRTQGWFFTKLGQNLERADNTSRFLDVKYHLLLPSSVEVGSPLDSLQWTALLKSVSGFNAYIKVYGKIVPSNIIEYLVLNRYFPRSIFFCLQESEKCLHEISEAKNGFSNIAEKEIGNLRADLEYADINDIFEFGVHEYLDSLQVRINKVSNRVQAHYFRINNNTNSENQYQE